MHVHILGICGTFMAGLAAIAREAGHRVTGSDRGVYPPMSDQLRSLGIEVTEGYEAAQLDPPPDLVIVGNVMSRGMPVVEALLNRRIPYCSGPEWLVREVLPQRWVVAIAGTHGKTTTTSLTAWILHQAGLDPGFLIGGVPRDFGISARLGSGEFFVIEADEYDTAFFDKGAKFLHYRPRTLVINNLEYDHADIYPDIAAIQRQFHQLVRTVPGNGQLIVRADDPRIREVLDRGCWTPLQTYTSRSDVAADWTSLCGGGELRLLQGTREVGRTLWHLAGAHNAENAAAAILAAVHVGVDVEAALRAVGGFHGVKRRLELIGTFGGVRLYDDFAHHPTAIVRTLAALRAEHSAQRLLIALEPRSNTMKLGAHREALAEALRQADLSWVLQPPAITWDVGAALASVPSATVCDGTAAIVEGIVAACRPGDVVVVMSNGDFQNIRTALASALARRGEV